MSSDYSRYYTYIYNAWLFARNQGSPRDEWDDATKRYASLIKKLHTHFMGEEQEIYGLDSLFIINNSKLGIAMSPSLPNTIIAFLPDIFRTGNIGKGFINEVNPIVSAYNIDVKTWRTPYYNTSILSNVPLECYYSIIDAMMRDDLMMKESSQHVTPKWYVEMPRQEIYNFPVVWKKTPFLALYELYCIQLELKVYNTWGEFLNIITLASMKQISKKLTQEFEDVIIDIDLDNTAIIIDFFERVKLLEQVLRHSFPNRFSYIRYSLPNRFSYISDRCDMSFWIRRNLVEKAIPILEQLLIRKRKLCEWLAQYTECFRYCYALIETIRSKRSYINRPWSRKRPKKPDQPLISISRTKDLVRKLPTPSDYGPWYNSSWPIETGNKDLDDAIKDLVRASIMDSEYFQR